MKLKKALNIASAVMAVLVVFFIGIGIYLFQQDSSQKNISLVKTPKLIQATPQITISQPIINAPPLISADGNPIYKNAQYGFQFEYPNTWKIISSDKNGLVVSFLRGQEAQDDILDVVVINSPIIQAEATLPYPYAPAIKIPVSSSENFKIGDYSWTKLIYPAGYGITDQLLYENSTTYAFQYLTNYAADVKIVFNTFKFAE